MNKRMSKGQQIYDFLRSEIEKGTFKAGELLPTDMDLAAKFETSRPTVAKSIQKLVDEGFLGRKAGLGTFLKAEASVVAPDKEFTFGLLIPSLGETEIFEPICGQIAQLADQYCFNLLWGGGAVAESKASMVEQLAQKYISQNVDGVFFNPLELIPEARAANQKIIALFRAAKIPVILLDSDVTDMPEASRLDLVGINNLEAGYIMGKHLLERSCKRIGFITRPFAAATVHLRWLGLKESLGEPSEVSLQQFVDEGDRQLLCKKLIESKVDAILACNDAMAVEIMMQMEEEGADIPNSIKLSGFDDVKYAKLLKVPLTTYRQPCREIGIAAVETMMSRLRHPEMSPRRVLLLGDLKARASTE